MSDEKKVAPAPAYPQTYAAQPVVIQQYVVTNPTPATNVLLSWLACAFCFPLGIVAVLKANEADRCVQRGDYQKALQKGQVARRWATAALITFFTLIVLGGVAFGVFVYFVSSVAGP